MTHTQAEGCRTAGDVIGMKVASHKAARHVPDRRTQSSRVPHRTAARGQPVITRRGEGIALVGQLDSKNRLSLPKSVRDAIHVGPGDAVFLNVDTTTGDVPTVRVVKAVNPLAMMLDALALDAVRQFHADETIDFDDLMDELEAEQESMSRTDAT